MEFTPIFIVGVPRSGTTLLRVLLDSHSQILALPETPWLAGAYGREPSLREMLHGLMEGPFGPARNISGVERANVLAAGRRFLEALFEPILDSRRKTRLGFKTPADIRHLDFLKELFPDAYFVHITRDGRDVSMSQMAKCGSFFNDLKEYRRLSFANAFRRWVDWEQRVRNLLHKGDVRVIHLRYEDLVLDPIRELHRVVEFLGLPFEQSMLDYAAKDHDYPAWEAGSTDVAGQTSLSAASVGKWRHARLTAEMIYTLTRYDDALVALGYPSSRLSPSSLQRAAAAGFPFIKPLLDVVQESGLWLRRIFRDVPRTLVLGLWLLLTVQFLVSGHSGLGLGTDIYQPLLCFSVVLAFGTVFGPIFTRRWGRHHSFTYAAVLTTAYLALLELAQAFAPDRHASPGEFLFNAIAAMSGLLLSLRMIKRAGFEPG